MSNYIYEEKIKITYYDLDCFGNLRLSSLLRLIAVASDNHATDLGFGYDYLSSLNVVFILLKVSVKIHKMPQYHQPVIVKTWPKGATGAAFLRNGEILDLDGTVMIEFASLWTLIDTIKRKIVRPSACPFVPPVADMEDKEPPKKIAFPNEPEHETPDYSHTVRYRDMDQNMHMNNTIYADLIMNTLPFDAIQGAQIQELQINYNNEAALHEKVTVQCHQDNGIYTLKGTIQNTEPPRTCFTASVKTAPTKTTPAKIEPANMEDS